MLDRLWLVLLLLLAAGCRPLGSQGSPGIPVRVGYVAIDPRTASPVMVLEDQDSGRTLPIWIGIAEAQSIASQIEHRKLPRPNTHDLAKNVLDRLESRVERVIVTELREGTYYAVLVVGADGRQLEIDARPSDAVALALRFEAPVFVQETLFQGADEMPEGGGSELHAALPVGPVPIRFRRASATLAPHDRFLLGKRLLATGTGVGGR